ncbi:MAG: hypothetical protein ACR2HX_08830 [Pyrinomonadaceae bacterium]
MAIPFAFLPLAITQSPFKYFVGKSDGLQIIVKIEPSPTMQRVAGAADSWATSYPTTGSAKIATASIRQENIST